MGSTVLKMKEGVINWWAEAEGQGWRTKSVGEGRREAGNRAGAPVVIPRAMLPWMGVVRMHSTDSGSPVKQDELEE